MRRPFHILIASCLSLLACSADPDADESDAAPPPWAGQDSGLGVGGAAAPEAGGSDGEATQVFPGEGTGYNYWAIAVDETNVYVTDATGPDGHVLQIPKGGGDATILARRQMLPMAVQVSADQVYFLTSDALKRVPVGGNAPETLAEAMDGQYGALVTDAEQVYWTNYADVGSVQRVPKAGGEVVTLAEGDAYPAGLVLQAGVLYWSAFSNDRIGSVPAAGGEATVFADAQPSPRLGIAATDTHLYWMTENTFPMELLRAPLAGGEPELVARAPSPASWAVTLVLDDTYAWFTVPECGLARVPIAGGEPEVHAFTQAQGCPLQLTADADALYFTSNNGVFRLAKAAF